ncbi:hypothetical protein VNI00_017000 [Paramarasmius palmivorus]|uniref:Sperm-lysin n=1 Tax=Paramarasmius palmivorus TaxID=297713 RepID=A0AAW0BC25_9AGAR
MNPTLPNRYAKPITAGETKFINAMLVFNKDQKRYLDQWFKLYLTYRSRTTDRSVSFWSFMHAMFRQWLRRWAPAHWGVWRYTLKQYWKSRLQERMIRYWDWKAGTFEGLKKLQRSRTPFTAPSSPAGRQPACALSMPMLYVEETPTKSMVDQIRGKRFVRLFDD